MTKSLPILMAAALLAAPASASLFEKGSVNGPDPRAAAQGQAAVARPDGAYALALNPAGLWPRSGWDVALEGASVFGGKGTEWGLWHDGHVEPLALGYGVSLRGYDSSGETGRAERQAAFGLGFPFSEDGALRFGAALKWQQADYRTAGIGVSTAWGMDLGLLWKPSLWDGRLSAGLLASDLESSLSSPDQDSIYLPQMYQAGAAWAIDAVTSAEVDLEVVEHPQNPELSTRGVRTGAERWFFGHFAALRLGWAWDDHINGRFSVGAGLDWRGFGLDYAAIQDVRSLGATHRLAVTVALPAALKPWAASVSGTGAAVAARGPLAPSAPVAPAARVALTLTAEVAFTGGGPTLWLDASGDTALVTAWRFTVLDAEGATLGARTGMGLPEECLEPGAPEAPLALPGGCHVGLLELLQGARVAGRASTELTVLAPVAPKPGVALKAEAPAFSPTEGSLRPSAVFGVAVTGGPDIRDWALALRDAKGREVRRFTGKGTPPAQLVWDGKPAQGRKPKAGAYTAEFSANPARGRKLKARETVTLDLAKPAVGLAAAPRVFDAESPTASAVVFTPAVKEPAWSWQLQVETAQGAAARSLRGAGSPPDSLAWDGRGEDGAALAAGSLFYASLAVWSPSGALGRSARLPLHSDVRAFREPTAIKVPLATVAFAEGEEIIGADQYAALKAAGEAVKKYGDRYLVQVRGYAAADETGEDGQIDALEMAALRARAVAGYLVDSAGIPSGNVSAAGYGPDTAIAAGAAQPESATAQALGVAAEPRRVDVILYTR